MIDNKVYDIMTDRIIKIMEKGVVPWSQKWNSPLPQNFVSKKVYTGFNFWFLYFTAAELNYQTPYWLTYNQIKNLRGSIKAGENKKWQPVIFFKMNSYIDNKDLDTNGKPTIKEYPLLRYYLVWNIEQVDGIEYSTTKENSQIDSCDNIIENYKDCPKIVHKLSTPSYSPLEDRISIPNKNRFEKSEFYYKTLFHEITHSTGHKSRLGRFQDDESVDFGSADYSKEELIAELGSAFLCAQAGISNEDMVKYNASYIKGWVKAFKEDKKLIIEASGKAQKAVNYVLGGQN